MTAHANWIAVASAEHVSLGRAQGFMQVCHGKSAPLRRVAPDSRVVYYSPTGHFGGKDKLQSFTAIGVVTASEPYQFDIGARSDAVLRTAIARLSAFPSRRSVAKGAPCADPAAAGQAGVLRRHPQLGPEVPLRPVFDQRSRHGGDRRRHGRALPRTLTFAAFACPLAPTNLAQREQAADDRISDRHTHAQGRCGHRREIPQPAGCEHQ